MLLDRILPVELNFGIDNVANSARYLPRPEELARADANGVIKFRRPACDPDEIRPEWVRLEV